MTLRLGNVTGAVSTYKGFLDGEPITWRVDGLPPGEEAIVSKSKHGVWAFLRTTGQHEWNAGYKSEVDVLRAIADEVAGAKP